MDWSERTSIDISLRFRQAMKSSLPRSPRVVVVLPPASWAAAKACWVSVPNTRLFTRSASSTMFAPASR